MKLKIFYIAILFFQISILCAQDVLRLINPQNFNSEYELDIFQNYLSQDWIWEWLAYENGFMITGGSLNIRHIYHERKAKLRMPVIQDRLWFRYHHFIRQVIQDEWKENRIELEYMPLKNLYLSVFGDPTYHKSEIDIGWSARYGTSEDNSIKISYILVDYDNNYAYRNRSVNEGFERFFRDAPIEWRLKTVYTALPVKVWIEGRHQRNWTAEYNDLNNANNNRILLGREYILEGKIQWDNEIAVPGIDFFGRVTRKGEFFAVPRPAMDHIRWEKRILVRPQVLIPFGSEYSINVGCGLSKHDGEDSFPGNTSQYVYFNNRNVMPFVIGTKHMRGPAYIELGYMHGTIDEYKIEGVNSFRNIERENRIRIALDFKFSTGARLKFISGWDLDKEDWGKLAVFDGGYVQFQAGLF